MLKLLIRLHRWLGVALCVLFLLWFPSGIGIVVIAFMIAGTALSMTSLILAWQALGKKLRRTIRVPKAAQAPSYSEVR
jgi:hypothetical protein